MSDFDTNDADNIGADLAGLIGELFENVVSANNLGLPQYEDILERIADLGKQAEDLLEKYRAWQEGKDPEPAAGGVMPTETNPAEILERIAPLLPYGGVAVKLITDKHTMQNHVFDTVSRCMISVTWRETSDAGKARDVYHEICRIDGISQIDWDINTH